MSGLAPEAREWLAAHGFTVRDEARWVEALTHGSTGEDRDYQRLVQEAGNFGFTRSAQVRLDRIHDRLQALAAQNPDSRYRQTQAKVARIHRSIWRTSSFRDLVATTETLLSVDPRVNIGRMPVTDATPDSAVPGNPPRRPQPMERLAPIPPTDDPVNIRF